MLLTVSAGYAALFDAEFNTRKSTVFQFGGAVLPNLSSERDPSSGTLVHAARSIADNVVGSHCLHEEGDGGGSELLLEYEGQVFHNEVRCELQAVFCRPESTPSSYNCVSLCQAV